MFKWTVLLSPVISGGPLSILRLLLTELSAITCFLFAFTSVPVLCWGRVVVKALRYSRTVPGSIPGNVTWDFSVVPSDKTMCPEVVSASENEYQGFLLE